MIQFQPLVVETPDFPSQLMIDTHLPVLCSGGFPPSGAFEKFENTACRQPGRWLAATPVSIVGFSQRPALTVMPAATVSSIPQSSAHQLSFFSFHDSLQYSPGRVAYSRSAVRGPLDGNCGKCLPIQLLSPS
jgi:hypothetical protein